MIVKPERGQATLICEWKSFETSDQPQTNAHFPFHATLTRKLFSPLPTLPLGNYQNLLLDLSNHDKSWADTLVTFTLTFLDLGWVSECHHSCFIPIWSVVQHLMTVTHTTTSGRFASYSCFSEEMCLPPVANTHIWWSKEIIPPRPLEPHVCHTWAIFCDIAKKKNQSWLQNGDRNDHRLIGEIPGLLGTN